MKKRILALILAALMLLSLSACQKEKKPDPGEDPGEEPEPEPEPNPAYEALFAERQITLTPHDFGLLQRTAFAMALPGGTVYSCEYGHNRLGLVGEYVETVFYPSATLTGEQRRILEASVRERYAGARATEYAEVEYTYDAPGAEGYYCVRLYCTHMHEPEALKELASLGLIAFTGESDISLELTEKALLEAGYVKSTL